MKFTAIDLNGSWLKVKKIDFKKSNKKDEEPFHDCYITFLDGKEEKYDAQDVTVLKEGEYEEDELFS
ncbi:hypothetical protein [Bacillus thuringiensis]|uniref:hypothetical protein n=1 Tax=Bacillus thuringiensis TaxID=1428 RepID=UPI0021D6483F|nr:hypothetical protein [Bacillus thuringiensis]MCU7667529.1 hypothetical protein [Bacillus thuringiensis]